MTKFSASQQSQLAQIGVFLREHREKQGKSLEDIALSTYIRPQLLSGIEAGDPDRLPEPIFVQGFIRRYGEALGLKGIEISQQFTVTSIPSTPRPAKVSEPETSSTTRFARSSATTAAPVALTTADNGPADEVDDGVPMFNSSPAETVPAAIALSDADEATDTAQQLPTADVADSLLSEQATTEDKTAALPLIVDDAVMVSETSAELDHSETTASELETAEFETTTDTPDPLPSVGLPVETHIPSLGDGFAGQVAADEPLTQTDLPTVPAASTPELDSEFVLKSEPVKTPQFNDGLPAELTTAAAVSPTPKTQASYSAEPVGVEIRGTEGPNLKPFVIGGIVIAALTAGLVLLANVLGGGDRTQIAESDPTEQVAVEDAASLPAEPEPEPEPVALSDAPIYVEANATAEAWVSVIADNTPIYEGTLQPGESQLWEAEGVLNIYSGDAGALTLSRNGGDATVMGDRGQPQEVIYEAE